MIKTLYLAPFMTTRVYDNDARGIEKFFRVVIEALGLRRYSKSINARYPKELDLLTNEFHHTAELRDANFDVFTHKKVNDVYKTPIGSSLLDTDIPLPSALNTNLQLMESSESYREFDLILLSSQSGRAAFSKAVNLKKKGVPVVYFDNLDREHLYQNIQFAQEYYNSIANKFDICFIKDLPLSISVPENIIPIAPVPVAGEYLTLVEQIVNERDKPSINSADDDPPEFGFYGRRRQELCRDDRQAMLDAAIECGSKKGIKESDGVSSIREIFSFLFSAKRLLAPSGRVWCTVRPTELSPLMKPIFINKPNCYVFEKFSYSDNLLIDCFKDQAKEDYSTYFKAVKKQLKEKALLIEGKEYDLASSWKQQVKKFHTRVARGKLYRNLIIERLNLK